MNLSVVVYKPAFFYFSVVNYKPDFSNEFPSGKFPGFVFKIISIFEISSLIFFYEFPCCKLQAGFVLMNFSVVNYKPSLSLFYEFQCYKLQA